MLGEIILKVSFAGTIHLFMFAVWTRPQPLSSDGVTLTAQPRHVDHDNHGCPPQDAQHQGPSSLQTSPAHAESLWCSEPHEKVPENPHCITKAYVTQPLCTKNVCIFHIWNFTIHDTCMIYIVIKCFMCFSFVNVHRWLSRVLAYMSLPDVFWSCSKFLSVEIYAVYVCNLHSLYTILLYVLHKSYAVVCDFCQMHAHIFSLISTTITHMFYRTKHLLHVIADKTAQYWHIILLMVLFGNFWPDLTFMYIFTCSLRVFFSWFFCGLNIWFCQFFM